MEPHAGVEPASSAWQADIIAIIRMRHMKFLNGATCRSRTGVLCMASRYNSHYTNAAYEIFKWSHMPESNRRPLHGKQI